MDIRNVHLGLINDIALVEVFAYFYSHKFMGLSYLLPPILFISINNLAPPKLNLSIKIATIGVVAFLLTELHKYDTTIALALE